MERDIQIGEKYLYLKDACWVEILEDLGVDPDILGHNLYKVKALGPCELLNIKEGDIFTAVDAELEW